MPGGSPASGVTFKETVNRLLRMALSARRHGPPATPFRVEARPLGRRPGIDYDHVAELLEQLEGPAHR